MYAKNSVMSKFGGEGAEWTITRKLFLFEPIDRLSEVDPKISFNGRYQVEIWNAYLVDAIDMHFEDFFLSLIAASAAGFPYF